MKKTNKKYIVICVAVILIIAIMVIYEITGNKNNSSQTDKSEYSVSTTDNEKNNADNFISDNKETQIRDDYAEIYDYEYQGNYARVKFKDGYWGIVNKNGKVIFDGADYIEKLPTVTALCSAVKNGHAIIFYLDIDSDSVQVIKSFDEYVNICTWWFLSDGWKSGSSYKTWKKFYDRYNPAELLKELGMTNETMVEEIRNKMVWGRIIWLII